MKVAPGVHSKHTVRKKKISNNVGSLWHRGKVTILPRECSEAGRRATMKKIMKAIRLLSTTLVFFPIMVGSGIAGDLQTGFGGIDWKTPLDQIRDCEEVESREGIQYCLRREQAHTLLGEPVPAVLYGFYNNAFFAVFVKIEEDDAYAETKTRLNDRLGIPETSLDKEGVTYTLWWTEGKVRIKLTNDRSKEGFRLVYYYQPIAEKALRKHKALFPSKWSTVKLFALPKADVTETVRILQF